MRQEVQRAGRRADFVGRNAQVLGSGGEAAMTEEELNGPQVGAGFEEMYGECVPKRMRGDRFGETGQTMCFLAGCFYGVLRDRPIIVNAWKQPLLRANGDPVAAQDLQQHGRQHHVPIFATFTLLDANNHTGTIDGGGLQPDGLRNAQACRVAGGQDHPMFVAIHAAEEMHNFFRAQDDG
jgi:hypothetical protein